MSFLHRKTPTFRKKTYKRFFFWAFVIISVFLLLRKIHIMTGQNIVIIKQFNNIGEPVDVDPIDNFSEFPCLDGVTPNIQLPKHGKCVRSISPRNKPDSYMEGCTYLQAGKKTPICTYDPLRDHISMHLHKFGSWEKDLIDDMISVMNKHPGMMLFDVGSNIGVYCISAALFNKHVVCLDANYENIRKIARSLYLGQLTQNATLIWNAVSDDYQRISFHIAKGNVGMSRIADLKKWHAETERSITVNSIKLNDLQDYSRFKNRPVFIKLDVESHELFVLYGADEFFRKVDVRIVQVELAEPETKWEVIELFEKYGFLPYLDPMGEKRLYKPDAFTVWPTDMYFVRPALKKTASKDIQG